MSKRKEAEELILNYLNNFGRQKIAEIRNYVLRLNSQLNKGDIRNALYKLKNIDKIVDIDLEGKYYIVEEHDDEEERKVMKKSGLYEAIEKKINELNEVKLFDNKDIIDKAMKEHEELVRISNLLNEFLKN